jgi:hypothetical protein
MEGEKSTPTKTTNNNGMRKQISKQGDKMRKKFHQQ